MQLLHESFERLVTGATISGVLLNATSGTQTDVAVAIEGVERSVGFHGWSLQVLLAPGGNGETIPVEAEVHWTHSTPVIVIEDQSLPSISEFSCRAIIYNHSVAASWKSSGQRGTFAGSLEPRHKSSERKYFVIERSGEVMRDWWTGNGWSDDWTQAKWYDHEPFAGSETGNEGAHAVYYPHGRFDQ